MSNGKFSVIKENIKIYVLPIIIILIGILWAGCLFDMIIFCYGIKFTVLNMVSLIMRIIIFVVITKIGVKLSHINYEAMGVDSEEGIKEGKKLSEKIISRIVINSIFIICVTSIIIIAFIGIFGTVIMDLVALGTIRSDVAIILLNNIMLVGVTFLGYLAATMRIKFNPSYRFVGAITRFIYAMGVGYSMILCVVKMSIIMNEMYVSYELITEPVIILVFTFVMYNVGMALYSQNGLFGGRIMTEEKDTIMNEDEERHPGRLRILGIFQQLLSTSFLRFWGSRMEYG